MPFRAPVYTFEQGPIAEMRGEYSYLPGAGIVRSAAYGLPDAVGIR